MVFMLSQAQDVKLCVKTKFRASRRRRAVARRCVGVVIYHTAAIAVIYLTAPAAVALTFFKRKKLAKTFSLALRQLCA